MSDHRGPRQGSENSADILYLIDQLEELVGVGKRVPLSNRVMVEEEDFLAIVDQLRAALPNDIRQAQRVLKERERIIGESQEEAGRIVSAARQRASTMVADHAILAEAKQRGEEILRKAEEDQQRTRGELDVFVMEQLDIVHTAVRRGMAVMEGAVETTLDLVDEARESVGK